MYQVKVIPETHRAH